MKVECPLCNKQVSEAGIGKHILSQHHRAHITQQSSKMGKASFEKSLESKLKARVILEYKKYGSTSRYCCFNCCSSTMNQDVSHFERHPECFENHKKLLQKFIETFGVVEPEGIPIDNKMIEENDKMKKKIKRLENTIKQQAKELNRCEQIMELTIGVRDYSYKGMLDIIKDGIDNGRFTFSNIKRAVEEYADGEGTDWDTDAE